jgi:hypothetical protein
MPLPLRQLRSFYFAYLSQPAALRPLYRFIRRHKVRRILELGVGTTERSQRLIEVATTASPGQRIDFTGVDLFELRSDTAAGVSLKLAHRLLKATGARIRLVPGDPHSALSQMANSLGPHDLAVISADQDRQSLSQAWFYVPRVLAETGAVFVEESATEGGPTSFKALSASELSQLAQPPSRRRAA